MRPAEWNEFYADVALRGIRVPIEVDGQGFILDGRHRYQAAQELGMKQVPVVNAALNGDDPGIYMLKAAVLRRHLTDDQRAMIATRWMQEHKLQGKRTDLTSAPHRADVSSTDPSPTRAQATETFKVSRKAVERTTYLQNHAPELAEQVFTGDLPLAKAYRQARATPLPPAGNGVLPPTVTLLQVPVAELATHIPGGSVDWIITDPPYGRDYLRLYDQLGAFAAHALRNGGSLLCMTGQSYLPAILTALERHLTYHWTLAYLTLGGQSAQLWNRSVNTFWKPVLWLTKGTYTGRWVGDVVKTPTNDNDKRFHPWGQSEIGIADIISRFTQEGDLIVDPFLGGGSTIVAAHHLNRRTIGADQDPKALETTRARL